MSEFQTSKRAKHGYSCLSPLIYDDKMKTKLINEHNASLPYKHVIIDDFCDKNVMCAVHDEALSNIKVNYKESDLFKVYQSDEIGNLDNNSTKTGSNGSSSSSSSSSKNMDNLLQLRSTLYSDEFRNFVGKIMGVNDLIDRVDCSINAYTKSCHLLCHDDVIATRRVSYIIYLTDPDSEWLDDYGGSLELYPIENEDSAETGIPKCAPTKVITPKFNRIVLFEVQPGRSYHSVQEVFVDKPRLSISGWFHGTAPSKDADKSSLHQLLSKTTSNPKMWDMHFQPLEGSVIPKNPPKKPMKIGKGENAVTVPKGNLKDIKKFLSQWVNPVYLQDSNIVQINETFCNDSSIQLSDFLKEEIVEKLSQSMKQKDQHDQLGHGNVYKNYEVGTNKNGWKMIGPPHMQRFLTYDGANGTDIIGSTLKDMFDQLFVHPLFIDYIHLLTTLNPLTVKHAVRRFRPGLDYTVAHHSALLTKPRLDATLCFVNESSNGENDKNENDDEEPDENEDEENDLTWEDGEFGGFECYVYHDEELPEAAQVFRQENRHERDEEGIVEEEEEDDNLLSVSPRNNVLNLVMRDSDALRFIKYISAYAPGSRYDICAEYEIEPIADDDDDEKDDDNIDEDNE